MTDMPARTDQSPPRQQDEAREPRDAGRRQQDEARNFEPVVRRSDGNDDIGEWMDFPDINTHGSER
jgi:hypothetical protein